MRTVSVRAQKSALFSTSSGGYPFFADILLAPALRRENRKGKMSLSTQGFWEKINNALFSLHYRYFCFEHCCLQHSQSSPLPTSSLTPYLRPLLLQVRPSCSPVCQICNSESIVFWCFCFFCFLYYHNFLYCFFYGCLVWSFVLRLSIFSLFKFLSYIFCFYFIRTACF